MRRQLVSFLLLTVAAIGGSCAGSPTQLSQTDPPALAQIAPSRGPVGTTVAVTGNGFAREGNTVKFGAGYVRNLESADGSTIRFPVPEGLDLCSPDPAGPCAGAYPRVAPGDYAVAVMTSKGTSNSFTFTVTAQ